MITAVLKVPLPTAMATAPPSSAALFESNTVRSMQSFVQLPSARTLIAPPGA